MTKSNKRATGVYLDDGLLKAMKAIAATEGKTFSDLVAEASGNYLRDRYGEDFIEALDRRQDPIEGIGIISAAQITKGESPDSTLLARFERMARERS